MFRCIFVSIFLVIVQGSSKGLDSVNFFLDKEWYAVPQFDGEFKMMHRDEILNEISDTATLRSADSNIVKYILHTRAHPEGIQIYPNSEKDTLLVAGFNPVNPVRFTIHGWTGGATSGVNAVAEFLKAGDFNHVVVDWSGARDEYIRARYRVPEVAKKVGHMAAFLVRMGATWANTYIIGHSLGGQMAGMVGKFLKRDNMPTPAACICLDPAGPLFSINDENDRAAPDDCEYVEAVHTNSAQYGMNKPIGRADFYVNGGRNQPGCLWLFGGSCSHNRVVEIFKESLVSDKNFEGKICFNSLNEVNDKKCQSNGAVSPLLGAFVNYEAKEIYYVETSGSSPFLKQ